MKELQNINSINMNKLAYIILICLLSSCNNKDYKKIKSEIIVDSLYLKIQSEEYNKPGRIYNSPDGSYIVSQTYNYGMFNQSVDVYNIKDQNHISSFGKDFDLNKHLLIDVDFIGSDSILLYYNSYENEAGIFYIFNKYGHELDSFKINFKQIINNKSTAKSYKVLLDRIKYLDGNIYFSTSIADDYMFGTDNFNKNTYPLIGCYNIKSKKVVLNQGLWYPNSEKKYYPENAKKIYFLPLQGNNVLISFSYSSIIYNWNIENQEMDSFIVRSKLIDSIYPLNYPTSNYYDNSQIFYRGLTLDNENNILNRVVLGYNSIYKDFIKTIVIHLDKNSFNYIGESFNTLYQFHHGKKWHLEDDLNKLEWKISDKKGYIKIVKNKFKFTNISQIKLKLELDSLKKAMRITEHCEINDKDLLEEKQLNTFLLNQFAIDSSNKISVIILYEDGCSACNEQIMKFIQGNKDVFNMNGFYVMFSGSKNFIRLVKNEYKFNGLKNVYYDTDCLITLFTKGSKNPRFVGIENHSITFNNSYEPSKIDSLMMDFVKFNKFEVQ